MEFVSSGLPSIWDEDFYYEILGRRKYSFFFCNNDIVLQSSSLVYLKRYVIGYVLNGSIFHSYISV